MTTPALNTLSPNRRADVVAAVYALERADDPVPSTAFRALAEPVLREVVEQVLAAAGRVLVKAGAGFLSAYDDQIAARLADEGAGVLRREDRAVLTLVLLFSVAIPRAAGKMSSDAPWTRARPVSRERLGDTKLSGTTIRVSLQRLQDAGIVRAVRGGLIPGPQFYRLTPAMSTTLFEEMILLAEPEGALADSIRRRRRARVTAIPNGTGEQQGGCEASA